MMTLHSYHFKHTVWCQMACSVACVETLNALLCDWDSSRQLVAWHRPFCVDLEESTFTYLCNFLKCYCDGLEDDMPPTPFLSKRCGTP